MAKAMRDRGIRHRSLGDFADMILYITTLPYWLTSIANILFHLDQAVHELAQPKCC